MGEACAYGGAASRPWQLHGLMGEAAKSPGTMVGRPGASIDVWRRVNVASYSALALWWRFAGNGAGGISALQ